MNLTKPNLISIGGARRLYSSYKSKAKKKQLDFNITLTHFHKLLRSNCHYCGVIPSTVYNRSKTEPSMYKLSLEDQFYNGVDRKDNTKGYIRGNVVPACKLCNFMKRDTDFHTFIAWLNRIKVYNGK